MDDLICPDCGRPNLSEAKKCWYCQIELVHPAREDDSMPPADTAPQNSKSDVSIQDVVDEPEEEIPEWLTRIRQKIEEDQGPEEELPYWKQKDIFGGEKKLIPKVPKEKKSKSTNPSEKIETEKNIGKAFRDMESEKDIDIDDLSSDLPDGFTKL